MLFNAVIDPEMIRLHQEPIIASDVAAGIHDQDQTLDKLLCRSIQIDYTLDNFQSAAPPAHKILGRIEFDGFQIIGQIGRG